MAGRQLTRRTVLKGAATLVVSGPAAAANGKTVSFAFSSGGHPYSYAVGENCVGLFPIWCVG